jgi:hypothetical protein
LGPLTFREKVIAAARAPVTGLTEVTMAEIATATATTTAEEIRAMTAGLAREEETTVAITPGETETAPEEEAEDETADVNMGTPEHRGNRGGVVRGGQEAPSEDNGQKRDSIKTALLLENSRARKRPVRKATPSAKALAARATNAARPARRL